MASSEYAKLLQHLWRENCELSEVGIDKINILKSSQFIDSLVHATYNATTENVVFLKLLKDGLRLQIFLPVAVIESITKHPYGKKLKCYESSLDILNTCIALLSNAELSTPPRVCVTVTRATFWLLENTIEIYKLLYSCMIDSTFTSPDPEQCINVIQKSQSTLQKLICEEGFEDINYVGKLLFRGDKISTLPSQMRDLLSFQHERIVNHAFYLTYDRLFKQFMNLITRFNNASKLLGWDGTSKKACASKSLHTFLQFQVTEYLSSPIVKICCLYDNILKIENLSLDQLFLDLYRFSINNVLIKKDTFEITIFSAFMFIKLPHIFCDMEHKHIQLHGDHTVLFTALQQISHLRHNDIDNYLGCDSFKVFVLRCQTMKGIDGKQCEQLLKSRVEKKQLPDNIVYKLVTSTKKCEDILKTLKLPIEENKERIGQELMAVLNMPDLVLVLSTFAASSSLSSLIAVLISLNKYAEKPSDPKDNNADVRADLFNNTFLLLCFIDAKFGDKVFIDVPPSLQTSFYMTWQRKCTDVTCRKMYNQILFDKVMEPMIQSYHPPFNQAQWDELCWSVGMIVKELTQAHLRRHFTTDALQKVCEGFKNKRPALCICAMVWLCTQYRTMPTSERARTAKIINLFKRPHQNQSRAAIWTPILYKYSLPLEADLLAANSKNKMVVTEHAHTDFTKLTELASETNLIINQNLIAKVNELYITMGIPSFAEFIIKLILESGKEEEAEHYEAVCTCFLLVKPIEVIEEIFGNTLKTYLYSFPKLFADPQGFSLCKCLSKAFSTAVVLYSFDDENPRPAKIAKLSNIPLTAKERLMNAFGLFLKEVTLILSTHEENAISLFVLNLMTQIAKATENVNQSVQINEDIVNELLPQLPTNVGRDTVIMLCDLTSKNGQDSAANLLLRARSMAK